MKPGDLETTKRALELCALPRGAKVLDIGCGNGATVRYLRDELGVDAWGIDPEPAGGGRLITGLAESLPFDGNSMDAVLFECSLSLVGDPEKALREAARVLRPGGLLYVNDLYARGEPAEFTGLLGRVEKWDTIAGRLKNAGFREIRFDDRSKQLMDYWARLVFDGGAGAMPNLPKRFRGGYFISISELEEFTPDSLASYQARMLAQAVARAKQLSPFYAEHLSGFSGSEPIFKLPTIDGDTIEKQGLRMLSVPLGDISRIRTIRTSGSTGEPKRIYFSEADQERTVDFFARGMRPLVSPGSTCAVMLSNDTPGSIADLLRRGLKKIGVETVIHGGVRDLSAVSAVNGAQCVVGVPSEIFWLCRHAPQLRPETVLLSADFIADSVVRAIGEAWGCRVFTHYGLTETCYGLAVQCGELEGQHIRHGDYIVEIIDPDTGAPLPPGREGEIVITGLRNEAMPLIRYRTGDVGSIIEGTCDCGGRLPRLGKVRGRLANLRQRVNIHMLDEVMYSLPGLYGYIPVLEAGILRLRVEGGPVDVSALKSKLESNVRVSYGDVMPYSGKRNITGEGL